MTTEPREYTIPDVGLTLNKDEMDSLIGTFVSPGWKIVERILDKISTLDVDTVMEAGSRDQHWYNAQGSYRLIKQIRALPSAAISAREEK